MIFDASHGEQTECAVLGMVPRTELQLEQKRRSTLPSSSHSWAYLLTVSIALKLIVSAGTLR